MRQQIVVALATVSILLSGCIIDDSNTDNSGQSKVTDSTSSTTFTANMVLLDKAYGPALFYSNIGKASLEIVSNTAKALATLKQAWSNFKDTHSDRFSDTDWSSGFTRIDTHIATAETELALLTTAPADQTNVHDAIEMIRIELQSMRRAVNVDWMMDRVTDAHHKMGPIASAVGVYEASAMDQSALDSLCATLGNGAVTDFEGSWNAVGSDYVANKAVLQANYHMSTTKAGMIDGAKGGLDGILAKLKTSVSDGSCDATDYANAAKIKPSFVKFFLAFGDFITPFNSDVIATQKALVPALYCTNNTADAATTCLQNGASEPVAGTLGYLNSLQSAMTRLSSHYPVLPPPPATPVVNLPKVLGWDADMLTAQTALATAISTAEAESQAVSPDPANIVSAHNEMETARTALYNISQKIENMGLMIDIVTEYHNAFEPIMAIVIDPASKTIKTTLSANEVVGIQAIIDGNATTPSLQAAFDAMQAAVLVMDEGVMGLSVADLTPKLNAQQSAIDTLNAQLTAYDAVNNDNSDVIASVAFNIKKTFAGFFKALGTWN